LGKILDIDPQHKSALAYLQKLDKKTRRSSNRFSDNQGQDPDQEGSSPAKDKSSLSAMFGLFTDWLGSLPSGCLFIAIFVGIAAGFLIYARVNTSLFGPTGRDFDNLVVSNAYQEISLDDYFWQVEFEEVGRSNFTGIVRHVSPIRVEEFSILTHDILVTTGDFADPKIVKTSVIDHKFFWKSPNTNSPQGKINLIHALPANKEIYQQLLEINKWDTVKITGREIFTLKAYLGEYLFLGTWQDAGCNTLLVESVNIIEE
jgi:hypothetical protein